MNEDENDESVSTFFGIRKRNVAYCNKEYDFLFSFKKRINQNP